MVGQLGLHQHAPGCIGTPGTPSHLHQFGKQPLRRAEVGAVEAAVGIEHQHQIQAGEIVAFGQHLRAHQYIHRPGINALI